jgi:hypothetical protein
MFQASLCPSSGEQDCLISHVVFAWLCWPWSRGARTQAVCTVRTACVVKHTMEVYGQMCDHNILKHLTNKVEEFILH